MQAKPSELRRDLHHGGWVLLPHQPEREQLLNVPTGQQFNSICSSVTGTQDSGAIILWKKSVMLANKKKHTVKVAANPYAIHKIEGDDDRTGIGMYDQMRGIGAHEVIIESEEPGLQLSQMSPSLFALTFEALQARIKDLHNDSRLKSFSWFREWTCGESNSSIPPHSQLVTSAVLPLGLQNVIDSAHEHYEYKERCLFCDIIRQELTGETRIVSESKQYIAFCPFASRYPFEVHVMPKKHQSDYSNEPMENIPELAAMMINIAQRYDEVIPGWRVIASMHSKPVIEPKFGARHSMDKDFHWHIEFTPIPPGYTDWYARTGMHIELTPPEKAAKCLQDCNVASLWD